MSKTTKKKTRKPVYKTIHGIRIVTNFPYTTDTEDYQAFKEANRGWHWPNRTETLYRAALARGRALERDSKPMTKRKAK